MGGSLYDTPFKLNKEPGNKFKVVNDVERSMNLSSEIPFLRTQVNAMDFAKTFTGPFGPNRSMTTNKKR